MLTGRKVLITGATGFIGGRLTEKLIINHNADVRVLVRNFTHASNIARFDLEMVGGDIVDADAVDRAVAGCEAVFHCAHDFAARNAQRNLDGARVLAEACLRHGVRRLVHVSSAAVYEPLPDGDLDESTPTEPCGWTYPDNKLAVERMLLRYAKERGLPVVVLQPTIVYGPFCVSWTLLPVARLRSGRVVLPSEGICNAVYVDDVVDALILAMHRDEAVGERFLVSGANPVTWREFYGAFERMLGIQSVVLLTAEEVERLTTKQNNVTSNLRLLSRDPLRVAWRTVNWAPVRGFYRFARRLVGQNVTKKARQALPPSLVFPDEVQLALYRARASVKIDKARRLLGYEPAFSFDRGMSLTAQYVAWAKL